LLAIFTDVHYGVVLVRTLRLCLHPLHPSLLQTNRRLLDFLPNFFAGVSFNASFINGLRVMHNLFVANSIQYLESLHVTA
jgi:hypothetical protein